MPKGKLEKCTHCEGNLNMTYSTLDLEEYICQSCTRVFTLYHVVKEWPLEETGKS